MKVYCSTSFQKENCPNCGSSVIPVDYYSARKIASSIVGRKTDYSGLKTTTTTTTSTQYSDIQLHTGGICHTCSQKAIKPLQLIIAILLIAGIATLITTILMLMSDVGYFWIFAIITVLSFCAYGLISKRMIDYVPPKSLNQDGSMNALSIVLINYIMKYCITDKNINGKTLFSKAFEKDLKGTGV